MNRKLLTALAAAAAMAVGVGATATPAGATARTFVVTLQDGSTVTLMLDVPADLPADQVPLPDMQLPVVAVSEVPSVATPTATATATATATPLPTAVPTPTAGTPFASPTPEQAPTAPGAGAKGGGAKTQRPTSHDRDSNAVAAPLAKLHKDAKRKSRKRRDAARRHGKAHAKRKQDPGSAAQDRQTPPAADPGRNTDGSPTLDNPAFSLAQPGAAAIGVPNFFIEKFRIPPFLLSIYQAAGIEYGVRWEVLAAINEIETDYGRNLNVSTAGAVGWMQFLPSTWELYGVDANKDGVKDPYNPVDAIFAAARYLRAAGADTDLARAIFAYNHADWYVDSVLLRARLLGGLPSNFVGSLTGLTQGRFPVAAKATYADDLSERRLAQRKRVRQGNAAWLVESRAQRRGINVYSRSGAPAVAVNDGRIVKVGTSKRLGRFVQLQDVYGNTFTYGQLQSVPRLYPAPRRRSVSRRDIAEELALPKADAAPTRPATAGGSLTDGLSGSAADALRAPLPRAGAAPSKPRPAPRAQRPAQTPAAPARAVKERLFANPFRPRATRAGGAQQVLEGKGPKGSFETYRAGIARVFGVGTRAKDLTLKRLRPGARVVAGTVLGRIGRTHRGVTPHLLFEIRPAGRGAPRIDPKPILDGWKLLESTAIYRAQGRNPFFGADAATPTIGQILLMSKEALQQRVLADPRIEMYDCGRRDVRLGSIDRRVLATLEFLSLSGLKPTVTSLQCGHGYLTTSGNVSEHSSGNAVDIARVNGIPILGHQGPGSITDITIQRLLTLQGLMKPHQIISLMTFEDADNTFAMADHADHIHVGFRPLYGTNSEAAKQVNAILEPGQWIKLIDRLGQIRNPDVRRSPSKYALETGAKRASRAHAGE